MPLNIVDPVLHGQPTLSELIAIYKDERDHYATNQGHETMAQQSCSGYVYVFDITIEALEEVFANKLDWRQSLLLEVLTYWQECLDEWKHGDRREPYQIARINLLETVIANLEAISDYD